MSDQNSMKVKYGEFWLISYTNSLRLQELMEIDREHKNLLTMIQGRTHDARERNG